MQANTFSVHEVYVHSSCNVLFKLSNTIPKIYDYILICGLILEEQNFPTRPTEQAQLSWCAKLTYLFMVLSNIHWNKGRKSLVYSKMEEFATSFKFKHSLKSLWKESLKCNKNLVKEFGFGRKLLFLIIDTYFGKCVSKSFLLQFIVNKEQWEKINLYYYISYSEYHTHIFLPKCLEEKKCFGVLL